MAEAKNSPTHVEQLDQEQAHAIDDKRLLRKIDIHIIPPLFLLYLLTFLDRTNIGNARIQGMNEELGLEGHQYNIVLMIFFIPYILSEVPSNLILKNVAPSTWLCLLVGLWGICTVGTGLVTNYGGLLAMRFLIGLFEGGFLPGVIYLLSMYYTRFELQFRFTIFVSASILAGAVGGLFAFLLAKLDGAGGYSGWRWIFIIEGIITVLAAVVGKFLVVDWPHSAKFLTTQEKTRIAQRLEEAQDEARMNHFNKAAGRRIFTDWKIWIGTLMYLGIVTSGYSVSFFMPTILKQMGFTAAGSQVRAIPVFIVAMVFALANSWLSDKFKYRYGFILSGVVVATIGYVILLCQTSVALGVQYMACFFVAAGTFMSQPVIMIWLPNNVSGHYKRACASAVQIGLGNVGGIVASNIFIAGEAPGFLTGYSTTLALLLFCPLMATVFLIGLVIENRKRERGERDSRLQLADVDNLGDDHPSFRFCY